MKIYTQTGDDGTTSLSGGRRVPKHSLRVEAYGLVDELIAWIGLLKDLRENAGRKDLLIIIQDQLMRCAASIADETGGNMDFPDKNCITVVENEIDRIEKDLPALNSFILPGGNIAVSYCHIARCVCRNAERAVLRLKDAEPLPEIINKYLNRLSDYLFVLARKIGLEADYEEVKWPLRKA